MKIVYLINENLQSNSGVIQKIKAQVNQWTEYGHTVYLLSYKTMCIYDSEYKVLYQEDTVNIKFGKIGKAIEQLRNYYLISKLIKKINFDFIYTRAIRYMPFITKVLKSNTVVMEINSDDTSEYKLRSKFRYIYNLLTRELILKEVDAFVSVSRELKAKFEKYNKPIVVIANGINPELYHIQYNSNTRPILLFIGSPNQAWHGLDKIIKMSKYFTQYDFYIVGTEGEDTHNLKYFGYLSYEDSLKVLNQVDIGIATLSLYVKNMKEASPLKTRQYLACGLPIIYAYEDTDISDEVDFALKLENKENNLNFEKINIFVNKVFRNTEIKQNARAFAITSLDFKSKEKLRLDFFKKVVNK